jgi:DNA-directed RNA polymerase specialized sigma24 family protein
MGVPIDERDEVVTTLLDDFVLALFEGEHPPRELTRYLVGALRNRIRNRHRARTRRYARHQGASVEAGVGGERVVAECHSQYGIRSIHAPTVEAQEALRSAVEKLAARSAAELSKEEHALMIGISYHVPLRELAAEAGITYGAARVRVHRLRERFLKLAAQHLTTLAPDERREIERFFRRASVDLSGVDKARRRALNESGSRVADRSNGRHNDDDVD